MLSSQLQHEQQQIVLFVADTVKALLSPREWGVSFQDFLGGRGWEKVIIICDRVFLPARLKAMYVATVGDK